MSGRLRSEQSGFTIVEAVVAALLLTLAATAVLTTFSAAQRATFRAEQTQVASDVAQRELENLRTLPYSQLALTSTPTAVSDPTDPRSRISGTNFKLTRGGATTAPLVVNGGALVGGGVVTGGTVDSAPQAFTNGDVAGTIQRYIVWMNDPSCTALLCPGTQDFKRAIVAVTINPTASGGGQRYVEVATDVINPTDSVSSNPNLPLLGNPTVAQQFWLSDERCQPTGEPAHSATLTDHALRDTLGNDCASTNNSRPDALLTDAPIGNPPVTPASSDGQRDFATDIEPTPNTDAGLQFIRPTSTGCPFKTASGADYKNTHIWVTRKNDLSGNYVLTGGATLKLWSKAINDVATSGKLCVIVFTRTEAVGGLPPVDVPLVNLSTGSPNFTYSDPSWPTGPWRELTIPMTFAPATLAVGQRLGISIGLEKQGSSTQDMMFNYDHPDFSSRLEVQTTTPLG